MSPKKAELEQSVDEELLIAYLSGRLSETERRSVERLLAERSDLRELAAALGELSLFKSGARRSRGPADAPESAAIPSAGSVIGERYRVVREIGRGAMGVVLEAEHVHLQERRAIKVLREEPSSEEVVLRFVREARAAMAVDSPQVARVFDMGALPGGRLYIVMEHLQGETLRDVLARRAPLPIDVAVRVVQEVCKGVAAAHAQGIVHRDLKPANIFLVGELERAAVKVLDFGLAKGVAHPEDVTLTTSASVLGSPMYMAPEQIRDARRVDARADVWALGVILHEALSGRPPFRGTTVSGLLASIVADRAAALPSSVPKHIAHVVERCLDKDPQRRIASATELEAALGEPERRRRIWIPIAGALAIVVAAIAVALAERPEPTPLAEPLAPLPAPTTPAALATTAAPTASVAPVVSVASPPIVRRRPAPAPPPAPPVPSASTAPAPIDPLLGEATETRR